MNPRGLPRPGGGTWLAAAAAVVLAAGCGASRPEPVAVDPPDVDRDTVPAAEDLGDLGRLDSVPPPSPPRPWLPMGIRWSPSDPREGEAVAVRLARPAGGRPPVSVDGELGGRPVRFVRTEDEWFGVAAAPIGSAGPTELLLEFRLGPDSAVVQRTELEVAGREFPATRLSVAPRYSDPSPEALARIREERRQIRATLARATDRWLPRGRFTAPRDDRRTSPFGQRRLFNDELQSRHTGLDLAGRPGDPVAASARGEVALTGEFYFAGRAVYLDHGLGVYTAYFHLSEIEVQEGETVERGELVGRVGSTGRVTGPHLHWSLYVGGESLDAASLLRMDVPEAEPPGTERPGTGDGASATSWPSCPSPGAGAKLRGRRRSPAGAAALATGAAPRRATSRRPAP